MRHPTSKPSAIDSSTAAVWVACQTCAVFQALESNLAGWLHRDRVAICPEAIQ
jgi:hypothetical protein